ncbi:polysaccharide biosynthesis/export family protein [Cerasicoccus fimbriatus]|uniref:polysaccharide biosynthesis/export family protein n=1 Tax=Cerasicoccus fimbriatus TaxID=3014554 RepID=UPI0022B433B0|nr:polysaccharide biosynthesis/export family protein [Cerasicoccus sp. TK19100]
MIARCLTVLGCGLLLLLAGCLQAPKPTFDPYAPDTTLTSPDFETLEPETTITPAMLKPSTAPYQLGPGDILEIEVAEIPGTLARTFIMPDGMVYYNLAGGVKAEGLTVNQLSESLAKALARDYTEPVVNITLVEVRSRRYWMLGRVYNPGLYPLRQPTTLIESIAMAGGLFSARFSGSTEELADLGHSIVIRDGEVLPVDFTKLIREGDMSQNIYLQHNDYIYLPSAQGSSVLLLGRVTQPKAVSYKDDLTLTEAIAYGLGPSDKAYLSQVVIVRGSLREPQVAVVDFYKIMTGQMPDVPLEPWDIVWIPQDPWETAYDYLKQVVRSAAQAIAINEGSRLAGGDTGATVSVPVQTSPTPAATPAAATGAE